MRRFGVSNLVALAGLVVQVSALALLTRGLGWHYAVASLLAVELAILQNFVGDNWWTWRDRRPVTARGWLARFVRYQSVKAAIVVLNLAVTVALVSTAGLPAEVASIGATVACSVFGYITSDRWIFTHEDGGGGRLVGTAAAVPTEVVRLS